VSFVRFEGSEPRSWTWSDPRSTSITRAASMTPSHTDGTTTTYLRLAEIKAKYDPENVFHNNKNVKPGVRGTST
jgi:hypothetical protein